MQPASSQPAAEQRPLTVHLPHRVGPSGLPHSAEVGNRHGPGLRSGGARPAVGAGRPATRPAERPHFPTCGAGVVDRTISRVPSVKCDPVKIKHSGVFYCIRPLSKYGNIKADIFNLVEKQMLEISGGF